MTGRDVNAWFQKAMANGLIATIAWIIILILYCTVQYLKIDAPGVGQAFLLLTGGWVGMLTLAQSKKNAETKDDVQVVKEDVEKLKEVAKEVRPDLAGELDG